MSSQTQMSMSRRSLPAPSFPISPSRKSALRSERGRATVRHPAKRRLWPTKSRKKRAARKRNREALLRRRRSARPLHDQLDLLQRGRKQLPLRLEARALNPLRKRNPLHVVDLAELRRQRAAQVMHQIEVDTLLDQRVAGAKEIFDRIEKPEHLGVESGLLFHLTQSCLLRGLALGDGALRQPPSRTPARGEHGHERLSVAKVDHGAARGVLVTGLPARVGHSIDSTSSSRSPT